MRIAVAQILSLSQAHPLRGREGVQQALVALDANRWELSILMREALGLLFSAAQDQAVVHRDSQGWGSLHLKLAKAAPNRWASLRVDLVPRELSCLRSRGWDPRGVDHFVWGLTIAG